jgi:hypothetical protein
MRFGSWSSSSSSKALSSSSSKWAQRSRWKNRRLLANPRGGAGRTPGYQRWTSCRSRGRRSDHRVDPAGGWNRRRWISYCRWCPSYGTGDPGTRPGGWGINPRLIGLYLDDVRCFPTGMIWDSLSHAWMLVKTDYHCYRCFFRLTLLGLLWCSRSGCICLAIWYDVG